jgi:hypothetical protein
VIILDTLIIGGLRFVLRRIADAVDSELDDVDVLREELLAAQMRLELEDITPEAFAALEQDQLARLRDIRARAAGDGSGALRITGIDVSVAGDDSADDPRRR